MVESDYTTVYELGLSASNLLNASECPLSVYCLVKNGNNEDIGQTEIIEENPNPKWENVVRIPEDFGISLVFQVFAISNNNEQVLLGQAESTVWLIAKNYKNGLTCRLGQGDSMIHINLKDASLEPKKFVLKLSGQNLVEMDWGGGSDPYIIIKFKDAPNNEIYKTEIIMKNINPTWRPFILTSYHLRFNRPSEFLTIECWDYDRGMRDDLIGIADVNVDQILSPSFCFEIYNEKNIKTGVIKTECIPMLSILGYLRQGLQFNFTFAIDFSLRTQNLQDTNSLFSYPIAIIELSKVFEMFDNDRMFFFYGFGARYGNRDETKQCFALNGNDNSATVMGCKGLLTDYINSKDLRKPAKEACLHEVIKKTMERSKFKPGVLEYNVLIILTNGEIKNIELTKNEIVDASTQPMSIIILGLGDSRFNDIRSLTVFKELKNSIDSNKKASRNIVQFFPFNSEFSDLRNYTTIMMNKVFQDFEDYMVLNLHNPQVLST